MDSFILRKMQPIRRQNPNNGKFRQVLVLFVSQNKIIESHTCY